MAVEAIVLNPPIRPVKLSRSELEALAGWPRSRGRPKWNRRKGSMARKRKVSAYARFVGKMLRKGSSMKSAARAWKSGRRVAANPKRPRHNYGTKKGARKAARKAGYKSPKSYFRQLGKLGAAARWGKKRPSKLRWSHDHRIAANPKGLGAFKQSFKQLISMNTLIEAAEITGGGLLSVALPNILINKFGDKLPNMIKSGWGKYLVNLVAAGLASGAASWFGKTRMAKNFLVGGVAFTVNTIALELLAKQAATAAPGSLTQTVAQAVGVSGMGILPASVESAVDRAVEAELARQGLRDLLPVGGAGMRDYLKPRGLADYLQPAGTQMGDYLAPNGMRDYPNAGVQI